MEQERQQALEMKDKLVQDFQEIRDEFYRDFDQEDRTKPTHIKQPNGTYKIVRKLDMKPAWISESEGIEWLQKVDVFFDHLIHKIEDTNATFDEIRDETYIIIRTVDRDGNPATIDLATCSKEAFGIAMMRECLKEKNLQMRYAPNWQLFAKETAKYIMDAASTN